MSLTYGSVCSGIEAATQAWHPLGWKPAFFSEIDKAARAVLTHHYPDVPLHGDFTTIEADQYDPIDILVGGTPCQSFSIAGLRGGLGDDRGNLALEFLKLAARKRARWLVWENVPGVFSSLSHDAPDQCPPAIDLDGDDGPEVGEEIVVTDEYDADENHALACFLAGLSELGYGWAYRVLDAQYTRTRSLPFAVPQRRRRIIVVGYIGDWRRAAAVLFDRQSLQGDPAPRREAGKAVAPTISARPTGGGGLGTDFDLDGGLVANSGDTSYCLTASAQQSLDAETETLIASVSGSGATHSLTAEGFDASEDGTGRGTPIIAFGSKDHGADAIEECSPTLRAGGHDGSGVPPAIAIQEPFTLIERGRSGEQNLEYRQDRTANAILTPNGGRGGMGVGAVAFDTTQITSKANFSNPKPGDPCHPLAAGAHPPAVAFDMRGREGGSMPEGPHHTANIRAASGGSSRSYVATNWAVRRLTPRECERLQGFPDDFTRIPWRGKPADQCPDGQRYKQCGNSMAVNVMEWIGERIQLIEDISKEHFA